MRINDVLVEYDQQDEGLGSAIGTGLGAVSKGLGAIASVPQGIGRAIKKGYQSGVNKIGGAPTTGTATGATATQQSSGTYQQGYQDGINAARGNSAGPAQGQQTGQNIQPTTQQQPQQAAAQSQEQPAVQQTPVRPIEDKKFMTALQSLKGGDIEHIRGLLQARVGNAVAEGLDEGWRDSLSAAGTGLKNVGLSALQGAKTVGGKVVQGAKVAGNAAVQGAKWAGDKAVQGVKATGQAIANAPDTLGTVAGKMGAGGTRFRQAYQNARGGSMTTQEIQRAIAGLSPQDAAELLQVFNGIHPAAEPASPPEVSAPNLQVQQGGRSPTAESFEFYSKFLKMDI